MQSRRQFGYTLMTGAVALIGAACGGAGTAATPQVVVVTATPEPKGTSAPATVAPAATQSAAGESLKGATGGTATAATGTPAAAGAPAAAGKATVSALWVGRREEGYVGGTSKVQVAVEKNPNKELRVGFYEEEVGGSGPMWRAAGWMAVVSTGFLLGANPTEYRYTYEVGGAVDGPSAGALMTIATVASTLGHTVKADAAMTGTINPDGTIGPVGGIPHKIDGAAKAGKKLVLIPAGQRQSIDQNKNQSVDVIERGKRQGVEVKEVSDIYEAYELMTGKPLPKPEGMKEARPTLPGASFDRTKSKAKEWYSRYAQIAGQYNALPSEYKFDFADSLMGDAAKAGDKADAYFTQGLPSAAYDQTLAATVNASIAFHSARVIQSYLTAGAQGALSYLDSMKSVNLKIDGLLDRLATQEAKTLGDVVAISDAYGNINLAMGLVSLANGALERKVQSKEAALEALTEATLYFALAEHLVETAKDSIDVGLGFGKAPAPAHSQVQALAEVFRKAAEANLNYFDNVVLGKLAEGAGLSMDAAKVRFASKEMTYTFAISSLRAMNRLKERAGGDIAGAYAVLGGSLNSYVMSSTLVAKYYSLGAEMDKEGNIAGVKNERAMINMLDFAEKRNKEIIGLGVSIGADPVGPVLKYESAKISREGDLDAKFNALGAYWGGALQGLMLGILSGKAKVVR